jgi:DNA-binding transcriptional LysR family regulator
VRFDLRQLRYFVAVAEEENVGRAAERLHISQSPLSRQIRTLEGALGFDLFERRNQRIRLTRAGRDFLTEARLLLAHSERIERRAQGIAEGAAGAVAVGFVEGAVYSGDLAVAMRGLRAQHPGLAIDAALMRSSAQHTALRDGLIDVGFAFTQPQAGSGLQYRLLSRDLFVLAGSEDHPALRGAVLSDPAELNGESFIAPPRQTNPQFRDGLIRACADYGFVPEIRYEISDEASLFALAAAGGGLTLAQRSMRALAIPGLAFAELPDFPLEVTIYLLWRADELSPFVKSWVDGIGRAAENL